MGLATNKLVLVVVVMKDVSPPSKWQLKIDPPMG